MYVPMWKHAYSCVYTILGMQNGRLTEARNGGKLGDGESFVIVKCEKRDRLNLRSAEQKATTSTLFFRTVNPHARRTLDPEKQPNKSQKVKPQYKINK